MRSSLNFTNRYEHLLWVKNAHSWHGWAPWIYSGWRTSRLELIVNLGCQLLGIWNHQLGKLRRKRPTLDVCSIIPWTEVP